MRMSETSVHGAKLIDVDRIEDDRGFFGRIWDDEEFAAAGMAAPWRQANIGYSHRAGTLRGMHFQRSPAQEWKLVLCSRGAVFDVALDLRASSPSVHRWAGHELSAKNRSMLLIPEGCAHGYVTLEDESEIIYLTSAAYAPTLADGVRWDDPLFQIEWPVPPAVISDQDATWPDWRPAPNGGST